MKRLAFAVVLMLALSGCEGIRIDVGDPPNALRGLRCVPATGQVNSGIVLMAQSVPKASAIPCLRSEPADWIVRPFEVRDGRAHLVLVYMPQQEEKLTVDLSPRCDVGAATESTTDQPGMRRYDRTVRPGSRYADERYFVHPDACTAFHFDMHGTGREARAAEIGDAFGFVGRADLDRMVRELTDDRLRLDPEPKP